MKKIVKNGLIAILVVLLALCLVGCPGNDPKNPASGSGSGSGSGGNGGAAANGGGIDECDWNQNNKTLSIDFKDGTWVSIHITKSTITLGFTSGDGSTPVYDTAMFQGAATSFGSPSIGINGDINFDGASDEGYLPSYEANWAVDFTKSTDPSVIFSFTIPKDYTAMMLAALE